MVEFGNFWYFFFILFAVGITVGLYFLFKNKSLKAKKIFIISVLFFNLALHFIKILFPPYSTNIAFGLENLWFINICAVSVLTFPFLFLSKSQTAKDWMFYIGLISGFLAVVYPTEALGKAVLTLDLWRFYICHIIIIVIPLLMVLWGVHRPNYKNIWKMPFCMIAVMLFIMCNQVLQAELGIIDLRGLDMLESGCGYRNTSLIWGPTDDIAKIFTWLTPDFMKTVPFGQYAGQEKYWPLFYLIPAVFFYFLLIPFLICLPWEYKKIKMDMKSFFNRFKKNKQDNSNSHD